MEHRTLAAVVRISYDSRTDLVEIIGRRQVGGTPARIAERGYDVISDTVMGWGDYDAIIHTDGMTVYPDPLDGYYLAKYGS